MKPPKNKVLHFPETSGFRPYTPYFSEESIQHPAKANLFMIHLLIEAFTKPGDIILDPMAGTGSTGVVANLTGRNAVLVDLEEKFCKWMRKNVKLTEERGAKGKSVVIQGDSRKLSQLLKENVDVVVTSPPYEKTDFYYGKKSPKFWKELAETTGRKAWLNPYSKTRRTITGKEQPLSKDNISNLPHGEISAIITSPPYSEQKQNEITLEEAKKIAEKKTQKYDSGVFTTPGRIKGLKGLHSGYSKDPSNIGNLPHGEIDAIITSPPYKTEMRGAGLNKDDRGLELGCKWNGYSNDPENLDNLEYGEIDAVITSPPYSEGIGHEAGLGASEKYSSRLEMQRRYTESMKEEGNIGSLKHGKIDTIITSPPYSESMTKKRKGYTVFLGLAKTRHMGLDTKDENIANLPRGEIDAVITSPPYLNQTAGAKDSEIARKKHLFDYPFRQRSTLGGDRNSPKAREERRKRQASGNIGAIGVDWKGRPQQTYLEAMLQVYRECWKVLKKGGKLIIIVKNFIRNKTIVRLDEDTIKLCQAAGFKLIDRYYRKLKQKSFWRILYHRKHPEVPTIDYEHILIFEKFTVKRDKA